MASQCARLVRCELFSALAILLLGGAARCHAADWNEGVQGDLSNSRTSPSDWNLTHGTNSLIASLPGSDLDYVTTIISAGHELTSLTLISYASTDGTSFIGVQAGDQVTTTSNAAVLLGYTHFGTAPGNVGEDILPSMGTGFGSIGFTPPLAAGNYSFWIQQASNANVNYRFDFLVSALPIEELPGNYNDDNTVDAADYTVWQDNLGSTTPLPNDPTPTSVDPEDYEVWKSNFGEVGPGAGAAVSSVPECSALALAIVAGCVLFSTRRP